MLVAGMSRLVSRARAQEVALIDMIHRVLHRS